MTSGTDARRAARSLGIGYFKRHIRGGQAALGAHDARWAMVDSDAGAQAISADGPPSRRSGQRHPGIGGQHRMAGEATPGATNRRRCRPGGRRQGDRQSRALRPRARLQVRGPICSCLRVCSIQAQRSPEARFFAVVISQAPGCPARRSAASVQGGHQRVLRQFFDQPGVARTRRATPATRRWRPRSARPPRWHDAWPPASSAGTSPGAMWTSWKCGRPGLRSHAYMKPWSCGSRGRGARRRPARR